MPSPFDMTKIRALAMSSTFAEAIRWIRNAWRLIEVVDIVLGLNETIQHIKQSDTGRMMLSWMFGG